GDVMAVSGGTGPALARFAGLRVLVVGDAMLDVYLRGEAERLCPEAPVPVVAVQERREFCGGAANVAVSAGALGASVTLLAVTGDDGEGRALRSALEHAGISGAAMLVEAGRRTLAKERVTAGAQLLVRVDRGDTGRLTAAVERAMARRLLDLAPRND